LPDGNWCGTLLTSNHNGENEAEVKRVREEHPGENECILRDRVLGAIAVTRGVSQLTPGDALTKLDTNPSALGDYVFKLPPVFTSKVFLLAKPGFIFSTSIDEWIGRNMTPPYLSRHAEVHYRRLLKGHNEVESAGRDGFLIMCSDGLTDLFRDEEDVVARWAEVVGSVVDGTERGNAALALLRDALGGEDLDKVSAFMTLESTEGWMDDTTVAVQRF
jgi:pyruvate dehydrogenase phosphatase